MSPVRARARRLPPIVMCLALAVCARQAPVSSVPVTPPPVGAAPMPSEIAVRATANLVDVVNNKIGMATFTDTPAGLLITGTIAGLGLGSHGIHLHAVGSCVQPGFASAGPHFNPRGAKHGFRNPAGHHAGDLPNLITPPAGNHSFQFVVPGVRLTGSGGLLDADGASLVIHSVEDDHFTDPAGNSGGRLSCGVITLSR
jgi:Cu-Zn family superoxide dismutase